MYELSSIIGQLIHFPGGSGQQLVQFEQLVGRRGGSLFSARERVRALNRTVQIPISCPQNVPVCGQYEQLVVANIGTYSYGYDISVKFYILDGSCEPRFISLGTITNALYNSMGGYRKDFEDGYVGCNRSEKPELCGGPWDLTNSQVNISYQ